MGWKVQFEFSRSETIRLPCAVARCSCSWWRTCCGAVDTSVQYGINPEKVPSIATFSPQYLEFSRVNLGEQIESFLQNHSRVFLSYVSFRPEYRLEILREGMRRYREQDPKAGYIWLGFPGKEMAAAEEFVRGWSEEERASLLLLGNLMHDQFLTLLSRCFVYLRTPACDGF